MQVIFEKLPGNVRGALWGLAATAMFVLMGALVKLASADYNVAQILFVRQVVMLAFIAPAIAAHFPGCLKTRRPGRHAVRLTGAFAGLAGSFTALSHLPLATAVTLSFAKTFFVTLIAVPLLGEVVGWRRVLAIVVGFAGMLIIVRPDPANAASYYAAAAIIGAAGAALAVVSVRALTRTESNVTLLAYQSIVIGAVIAGPALWLWRAPDAAGWALLVAIGAVSVVAQWLGVQSYRAGEASVVTGVEFTKVIYASVLGVMLFGEWPEAATLAGAAVIISASAYTIWREQQLARAAKSV